MTREETMTTTDDKQKEKIKTPFAKVIVDGRGANSYFSILYFDPTDKDFHIGYSSYYLNYVFNWLNEEFEIVEDGNSTLAALRPVSREQVEKVWRGCEWCNGDHSNNGEISAYAEVECEGCDAGDDCPNAHSSEDLCYGLVDRALPVNFCPVCGKARTDEAVQMVMERLEALKDD